MIKKIQKAITDTLKNFEVKADGKYGVDTEALSQILTTEIFKEINGINSKPKKVVGQ